MLKRNKKAKTAEKAKAKKVTAKETEKAEVKKVVNADEMAKAVSTTSGNDYQQYIRNLFKDKLN